MPHAVALGELLIDFVSEERDVPLTDLPRFSGAPGGAPANVAVGLSRLGVPSGFIGKVGADPFGEFLKRTLDKEGVETEQLRLGEGTRTTLAFIASRSDGRKDICFYRHPGADMLLTAAEINQAYLRSARLFHFGSVSLSRPPAREATLFAAELAKQAGLTVSYDPNWRPSLWGDHRQAKGFIWEAMRFADIVHCAEEEWEFITGETGLEAGAGKVLSTGPKLVVVTRGRDGCYYDTGSLRGFVSGFKVEAIDPLGAGDAFVAGMLSHLIYAPKGLALTEEQLREALTHANASGALTCTRRGVIPALPTAGEVEGFLRERAG
jgi:fructokinase